VVTSAHFSRRSLAPGDKLGKHEVLRQIAVGRIAELYLARGVRRQIANRDAEGPSKLVPDYPPAFEPIVMRALARDPERRFATALEMQQQIEGFARDSQLRVSPLVVARLMSTLFPARLEKWEHARAQGAFFVEEYVCAP